VLEADWLMPKVEGRPAARNDLFGISPSRRERHKRHCLMDRNEPGP